MPLQAACLVAALMGAAPGTGEAEEQPGSLGMRPPSFTVREAVLTKHTGAFNGRQVDYVAAVAGLDVPDAGGGNGAHLVTFAYVADAVDGQRVDPAVRPVLFLFNGGPIVASTYLHMGSVGPQRVVFPDDPATQPLSWQRRHNPDSLLDVADLVFIDPAGTGFSRVAPGKDPLDYYSVAADAQQVAAFIAAWLRRHDRTAAPAYVLGESYGTIRAAEVGRQLAALPEPILLDGMVLFGQAVNIAEYAQRPRNIISYVVSLPTLAATAWHHGKVEPAGRTLEEFLAAARAFARDEYLPALFRGNTLPEPERRHIAARLEDYSGIPAGYYLAHDLRITKEAYRVELLRDAGLLLGRNDSRYTAPVTGRGAAVDPSKALGAALEQAFAAYLRDFLRVDWDERYLWRADVEGLDAWDWGAKTPFDDWPYVDAIAEQMTRNPRFRVMLATGYHDTQTTMGAAEMAATQSGWPPERTWIREYPGGHMAYTLDATARAFATDLRLFVLGAH